VDINEKHFSAKFYYLGNRPYIQGVVIVDRFLSALKSVLEELKLSREAIMVNQVKFIKEVKHDGLIKITTANFAEEEQHINNSVTSEMICTVGYSKFLLRLYECSPLVITERREDGDSMFVERVRLTNEFAGHAILHKVSNTTMFLTGLIQANKQIHLLELNDTNGLYEIRWVYMKSFPIFFNSGFPDKIDLSIYHHGAKKNGKLTYTLNTLNYMLKNKEYKTQFCFYYLER